MTHYLYKNTKTTVIINLSYLLGIKFKETINNIAK